MAIDFPTSPATNDTYTFNGRAWKYNGEGWEAVNTADVTAFVPVGTVMPYGGISTPSGYLLCDGSAVSRTTYATLFGVLTASKGTFTVTIASPGVFTLTSHGLAIGDAVYLTTTGALPTGLTANTTTYYVLTVPTANTFTVSASRGGSAVNTSGSQSGTHTLVRAPYGVSASTTFLLPDLRGRAPFGNDSMGGTAASRVTQAASGVYGAIIGGPGGAETHTLTSGQSGVPAHSHGVGAGTGVLKNQAGGSALGYAAGANMLLTTTATENNVAADAASAHNNMPPALILNYLIKT